MSIDSKKYKTKKTSIKSRRIKPLTKLRERRKSLRSTTRKNIRTAKINEKRSDRDIENLISSIPGMKISEKYKIFINMTIFGHGGIITGINPVAPVPRRRTIFSPNNQPRLFEKNNLNLYKIISKIQYISTNKVDLCTINDVNIFRNLLQVNTSTPDSDILDLLNNNILRNINNGIIYPRSITNNSQPLNIFSGPNLPLTNVSQNTMNELQFVSGYINDRVSEKIYTPFEESNFHRRNSNEQHQIDAIPGARARGPGYMYLKTDISIVDVDNNTQINSSETLPIPGNQTTTQLLNIAIQHLINQLRISNINNLNENNSDIRIRFIDPLCSVGGSIGVDQNYKPKEPTAAAFSKKPK